MTFLAEPCGYTPGQFDAYVKSLHWMAWRPKFIVLHNSAEPNLTQWLHFGAGLVNGKQRVKNLNAYYEGIGWHSGPHLFVAPDFIWTACNLLADGVHASCYNHASIGVEMVGDYEHEAFNIGAGAKVRDNTIAALATLHHALELDPATLRFHRECIADHHACPGKNVVKSDIIVRVRAAMEVEHVA